MSLITASNKRPETRTEKYMNMETRELKKLAQKKGAIGFLLLAAWIVLLLIALYYYMPLILLWLILPPLIYLLTRKNADEFREITAIIQARKMAERINEDDMNSPFSLSDFRKGIFYHKLIWKLGPEKGAAVYVGIFLVLFILAMGVVGFVQDFFWPGSGDHWGSIWYDPVTWLIMGLIYYYTFKKQAEKQKYHIKKELRRREEEKDMSAISDGPAFRRK